MSQYQTIMEIVDTVLIDIGEQTNHQAPKYLNWALRGLKELQFDTHAAPREINILMNANKTVSFPSDYIDWVEVGIWVGNQVFPLAFNSKLVTSYGRDNCGNPTIQTARKDSYHRDSGHYYYGGYVFNESSNHTGFTSGNLCYNYGYFDVDDERGWFTFSSEVPTGTIHLKYLTNGINATGDSLVHTYAAEALTSYIHWKRKQHGDKFSANEREHERQLYYNELRKAKARLSGITVLGVLQALQKGFLKRQLAPAYMGAPEQQKAVESCTDPFIQSKDDMPKRYWGISQQGTLQDTAEILTLQNSEFANDRYTSKTLDATGGYYLYFSYPVEWGEANFIFNGFPTAFLQGVVSFQELNNTIDYYVYRSLNLQNGNSLTVTIQ